MHLKTKRRKKRKRDKTSPQVANKVQVCIANDNNTIEPSGRRRYHCMDIFWNHTWSPFLESPRNFLGP